MPVTAAQATERAVRDIAGTVVPVATGDRALGEMAARQHGCVSARQLEAIGLTRHAIAHRVAEGRLHAWHRGVFLVGGAAPQRFGREAAAVLACAPAVASHRSAAALWDLLRHQQGSVHVTSPTARRARHAGITAHRSDLPRDEIRIRHGLPVTSPARTLLDLAASTTAAELARAAANAYVAGLAPEAEIERTLSRHAGRPGTRTRQRILDGGLHRTRSNPERDLAARCVAARLAAPQLNATVAGLEVDAHWPSHRVVVEIDTLGTHGHARACAADRRRDQTLQAAGIAVLRVTDQQLAQDRPAVTAVLAATLARRG